MYIYKCEINGKTKVTPCFWHLRSYGQYILPLRIETGRYTYVGEPFENRHCTLCDSWAIETDTFLTRVRFIF